ncbi:MAG: hypothetical protein KAS23_06995 [Anaerohalosphaera sp.]|nr:hypothetical protein [Anaerohalosphaera sp.]
MSRLVQKLANPPEPSLHQSLCAWTDLLGFGNSFVKSQWCPKKDEWASIAKRIANAHTQCFNNLDPFNEFALILNDGLVRCHDADEIVHFDHLSFWLRSCVWTHNAINEIEKEGGHPGARTVVTAGENLRYSHVDFRLDDFVYNYTKPDPNKLSNIAKRTGNPVVLINPGPLQMNIAFSKAYILDSLGSKQGIKGPHFYVDESFLLMLTYLHKRLKCLCEIINRREKKSRLFAIPSASNASRYHLGLELEEPCINIKDDLIKTKVWRLIGFYPCDEDVADFKNPVC